METSVSPNMTAMQGTEDVPNDPGYVCYLTILVIHVNHLSCLAGKCSSEGFPGRPHQVRNYAKGSLILHE